MKLDHLQPDPWLNISSSTGPKHSNSRAPISLPISSGPTTPTCWKRRPSSSCSSSVSWERINQTRCCSWSSTMPQWRACSSTALVFGMQGLQLRTERLRRGQLTTPKKHWLPSASHGGHRHIILSHGKEGHHQWPLAPRLAPVWPMLSGRCISWVTFHTSRVRNAFFPFGLSTSTVPAGDFLWQLDEPRILAHDDLMSSFSSGQSHAKTRITTLCERKEGRDWRQRLWWYRPGTQSDTERRMWN